MGAGHELLAIRNFESFMAELPAWDLEGTEAFRLSWVFDRIRNHPRRTLELTAYEERMYDPHIVAFAEEVVVQCPGVLDRHVSVGRGWLSMSQAIGQFLDRATAESIVFGGAQFGDTSRVAGGARYSDPASCAEFAELLANVAVDDFVASVKDEANLVPDVWRPGKQRTSAPKCLKPDYFRRSLVDLKDFYAEVADHGDGALGIRD